MAKRKIPRWMKHPFNIIEYFIRFRLRTRLPMATCELYPKKVPHDPQLPDHSTTYSRKSVLQESPTWLCTIVYYEQVAATKIFGATFERLVNPNLAVNNHSFDHFVAKLTIEYGVEDRLSRIRSMSMKCSSRTLFWT